MGGRNGRGIQLATRLGKPLLHFGKFQSQQRSPGGEHEIDAGGHERLVSAIDFTETAFGTIALNGISHGDTGGHDAHPRSDTGRLDGTSPPSQEKSPAIDAAALLAHGTKIVIAPQTLPGAKIHLRQP